MQCMSMSIPQQLFGLHLLNSVDDPSHGLNINYHTHVHHASLKRKEIKTITTLENENKNIFFNSIAFP